MVWARSWYWGLGFLMMFLSSSSLGMTEDEIMETYDHVIRTRMTSPVKAPFQRIVLERDGVKVKGIQVRRKGEWFRKRPLFPQEKESVFKILEGRSKQDQRVRMLRSSLFPEGHLYKVGRGRGPAFILKSGPLERAEIVEGLEEALIGMGLYERTSQYGSCGRAFKTVGRAIWRAGKVYVGFLATPLGRTVLMGGMGQGAFAQEGGALMPGGAQLLEGAPQELPFGAQGFPEEAGMNEGMALERQGVSERAIAAMDQESFGRKGTAPDYEGRAFQSPDDDFEGQRDDIRPPAPREEAEGIAPPVSVEPTASLEDDDEGTLTHSSQSSSSQRGSLSSRAVSLLKGGKAPSSSVDALAVTDGVEDAYDDGETDCGTRAAAPDGVTSFLEVGMEPEAALDAFLRSIGIKGLSEDERGEIITLSTKYQRMGDRRTKAELVSYMNKMFPKASAGAIREFIGNLNRGCGDRGVGAAAAPGKVAVKRRSAAAGALTHMRRAGEMAEEESDDEMLAAAGSEGAEGRDAKRRRRERITPTRGVAGETKEGEDGAAAGVAQAAPSQKKPITVSYATLNTERPENTKRTDRRAPLHIFWMRSFDFTYNGKAVKEDEIHERRLNAFAEASGRVRAPKMSNYIFQSTRVTYGGGSGGPLSINFPENCFLSSGLCGHPFDTRGVRGGKTPCRYSEREVCIGWKAVDLMYYPLPKKTDGSVRSMSDAEKGDFLEAAKRRYVGFLMSMGHDIPDAGVFD